MSKTSELAGKIRSLPTIDVERARITICRRATHVAQSGITGLADVLKQAPYIDQLTNARMVTIVTESVSFAADQAKRLKTLIQRANFGSEQKISEYLENITKKKQTVETKRNELWASVQAKVNSVEIILRIAETVKLDSVKNLRLAATSYKQATASPPSSTLDTDRVKSAEEGNKAAITNSGLTGNVKKLLDGAVDANGDPRLLLEEDVQRFFKDHPALWESLKLKLA